MKSGVKVNVRAIQSTLAALIAGLVLVSCSSTDSDGDGDAIEGVQTENAKGLGNGDDSTEASESSPEVDGGDRPVIRLPEDMENVFADTETGEEVKDAILQDLTQQINAVDMAIAESNPGLDAVEFYTMGTALVSVRQYIRGGSDYDRSWAGTAKYYDFDVSIPHPGDAGVTYCVDSTGVQTKELDTGELWPKPENARNFNYTRVTMQENDSGVWQVSLVLERDEELDHRCER